MTFGHCISIRFTYESKRRKKILPKKERKKILPTKIKILPRKKRRKKNFYRRTALIVITLKTQLNTQSINFILTIFLPLDPSGIKKNYPKKNKFILGWVSPVKILLLTRDMKGNSVTGTERLFIRSHMQQTTDILITVSDRNRLAHMGRA